MAHNEQVSTREANMEFQKTESETRENRANRGERHTANVAAEMQIRGRMHEFSQAFIAKDLDKIMSFYAPDVVAFDIVPPLQVVGKDAYRKSWEKYLPMMTKVEEHETHDLHVTAGEDIAFTYCLAHMVGITSEGTKMDTWMRHTAGFRKIDGEWLVTHEQLSVPIEMESNKALWELKPQSEFVH